MSGWRPEEMIEKTGRVEFWRMTGRSCKCKRLKVGLDFRYVQRIPPTSWANRAVGKASSQACNSGRPGGQRRVRETLYGLAAEIEGSAFRVSPEKTREVRRFGEEKMVGDLADVQISVGQQALGLKDDSLSNDLSRILSQARLYRRT